MAKRPRLEAPSAADLAQYEAEFRRETLPRMPLAAPIAQVAAEAAAAHDARSLEIRAAQARDASDADRLRVAEAQGLLMVEIAVADIDPEAIIRDRIGLDDAAMTELQLSISENGLRLPIEVFELPVRSDGTRAGPRYGLLSGYRRLRAYRSLQGVTHHNPRYDRIRALVRGPASMAATFAAMVEENEIRAGLSQFERGRIAVLAAHQGAFPNVEAAVEGLFRAASKAKRSKIRSFASIFEELGDLLSFPEAIREKDGLRLATALRDGHFKPLREVMADARPADAAEEAAILEAALDALGPIAREPARGGRPPAPKLSARRGTRPLATGVTLTSGQDGDGWYIRLDGDQVSADLVEAALRQLRDLLGPA